MRKTIVGVAAGITLLAPQVASAEPEPACKSFGKSQSRIAQEFGFLYGSSVANASRTLGGEGREQERFVNCWGSETPRGF